MVQIQRNHGDHRDHRGAFPRLFSVGSVRSVVGVRRATLRCVALAFALVLAGTTVAWANGEEFFVLPKDGKVDLLYFGRIKNSQTGRSVTEQVYFLLTDKSSGLSFEFTSDKPGHYRSPDVGTAIKGIGENVNVNAFELTTVVAGYRNAQVTRLPRKSQGAVELEMRLEPIASSEVSTAGLNAAGRPGFVWLVAAAALVLVVFFTRAWPFSTFRRSS